LRNWSCPVLLAHSLLPNPTQSAHSSVLPANTACPHSASQHSTACLQVVPRACPALLAHNPVLPTDGAQPSSAHSLQHSLPAGACPAQSTTYAQYYCPAQHHHSTVCPQVPAQHCLALPTQYRPAYTRTTTTLLVNCMIAQPVLPPPSTHTGITASTGQF
jgi:hypothetical protein